MSHINRDFYLIIFAICKYVEPVESRYFGKSINIQVNSNISLGKQRPELELLSFKL